MIHKIVNWIWAVGIALFLIVALNSSWGAALNILESSVSTEALAQESSAQDEPSRVKRIRGSLDFECEVDFDYYDLEIEIEECTVTNVRYE